MHFEVAYVGPPAWGNRGKVIVPDVQIMADNPEYVYHPARGYSASLLVFDIDNRCIGWIDTRVFGFDKVKDWMEAVKYRFPTQF